MLLLEAYVLDFDGDLYGQTRRRSASSSGLRGEERFDTVDALVPRWSATSEATRRSS